MISPLLLMACCATATPAPAPPTSAASPPAADSTVEAARPRLLVLGLESRGVPAASVSTIDSLLVVEAQRLDAFDIVSADDVRRILDLEAQRSQIGCNDQSCLAEVAGAMGASLVLFGDVGTLDGVFSITLNLFDSSAARALGRTAVQANTMSELSPALAPALRQLVAAYATEHGLTVAPLSSGPGPALVVAGGAGGVAVVGVVAVAVGMIPWLQFDSAATVAKTTNDLATFRAANDDMDSAEAAYASWGQPTAVVGGIVAVAGVAVGVGALGWALLGGGHE